jgi:hypothetical protein
MNDDTVMQTSRQLLIEMIDMATKEIAASNAIEVVGPCTHEVRMYHLRRAEVYIDAACDLAKAQGL